MKVHNFSAGPAILPRPVIEEAAQALLDFNGIGLSILELSHRGKEIVAVMQEAEALVRDLMDLSSDHHVLFLTGGASTQFFMVPQNCLPDGGHAAYTNTGRWSDNAIKEAQNFGRTDVVGSSKEANYTYIPKDIEVASDAAYLHITSNNTVTGSQYHEFPKVDVPLVADMSSDIFSRPIDYNKFGIIYAGAQKNLGPAGTTLVVVHKDMLDKVKRTIPTMLDYRTHIAKKSAFNTPPVYPIYVSMLTMRWIKASGGLKEMERRNLEKSNTIYKEIDRNPLFRAPVAKEDRSIMNAVFVLEEPYKHLQQEFLDIVVEANYKGLKGHRSIGGFRASMYNAMDIENVNALTEVMKEFERKHG